MLRNKYIIPFLFSVFMCVGALSVSGQTAPDSAVLLACEQTADKAKRLDIENVSLKAQLSLRDEKIALRDEQLVNLKEQLAFYKAANEKSDQIDKGWAVKEQIFREQIADSRSEIERLRAENQSLRNSRNWRTVLGAGLGFGIGYAVKK